MICQKRSKKEHGDRVQFGMEFERQKAVQSPDMCDTHCRKVQTEDDKCRRYSQSEAHRIPDVPAKENMNRSTVGAETHVRRGKREACRVKQVYMYTCT